MPPIPPVAFADAVTSAEPIPVATLLAAAAPPPPPELPIENEMLLPPWTPDPPTAVADDATDPLPVATLVAMAGRCRLEQPLNTLRLSHKKGLIPP